MTYQDTIGNVWASGPPGTGRQGYASPNATLLSPVFTGDPEAPTPGPLDNSVDIATTAYVDAAVALTEKIYNVVAYGADATGVASSQTAIAAAKTSHNASSGWV